MASDLPMLARWLAEPQVARWWNHDCSLEGVERDFGPSSIESI
jgi:aminoglycoside 6'-N-acetyltransferase